MTSIIISGIAVFIVVVLIFFYVVHFGCEIWQAWKEYKDINNRFVCRVTGKAWEHAMRKVKER